VELVSKISNLCDPDPPTSQTDRRTACDRKTALCTIVSASLSLSLSLSLDAWGGTFLTKKTEPEYKMTE